ncbi:MAG TPA: peptidylprolyl isomerase [Verrucomicrobiae bacterium]|nr:peptidylprolyl isomerase [Verrucomicrobiae bacterium]
MRNSISTFLAVLAAGGVLSVRAAEIADSLNAVVNEVPITQQAVERISGTEEQYLFQQYNNQPDILNKKVITLRQNASEFLINREVILHDFKTSIKVPDSIIDDIVSEQIKKKYPDNIALTKQLQAQGTTLEELRQQFRDQFIVEQMRLKFVPEPIISPLKIEQYYTAHLADFKLEDQIKMRMIFLKKSSPEEDAATRKRAGEILSQIKGGASFEELARSYSEGSLRSDGGETGWEDLSVVNKTLAEAVNQLKPGQYSDVIEASEGFYLLLLEDRHAAHYKPLNEVRVAIEHTLSDQETERLQKQWIDRLRKKTFVQVF